MNNKLKKETLKNIVEELNEIVEQINNNNEDVTFWEDAQLLAEYIINDRMSV